MSEESEDPTLDVVLRVAMEAALDQVRVTLPARIVSYDSATQKASVQILIKHAHVTEDKTRKLEVLPEVHNVPVMFLGPARGRITWPVAAGDVCILWFSSSSLDAWVQSGGIVEPKDDRRHDLNDAIAMVGLHDFAHVLTTAPTDCVCVHGDVKLGGPTGTEKTIKAATWESGFDSVINAIATALDGIVPAAGLPVTTAWNVFKATAYQTDEVEVK